MKKPNEIKKGFYSVDETKEILLIRTGIIHDRDKLYRSALAYIQQLETANAELLTKVEQLTAKCRQLERERDALVDIIKYESTFYNPMPLPCRCCKNNDGDYTKDKCRFCGMTEAYGNFEWRGVKEE